MTGGEGALFQIEDIGYGKITEIILDNKGVQYEVGDKLVFNNAWYRWFRCRNGFVSIINGGFAGQNGSTARATGVEDRIILEDETTSGDAYEGRVIMQEKFTDLQTIEQIFLTNGGGTIFRIAYCNSNIIKW